MSVADRLIPIAQNFAQALVNSDFATAHSLLTPEMQQTVSIEELQRLYRELTVAGELSVDLANIVTMEDWPAKQSNDLGWAYVSLSGDICSEAVTVIVTKAGLIRDVEWGRP